ncbi:MAG: hypothetical protein JOZ38_04775 [Candidatus Eremiobacteraeota bacterium]|nr:hypothetical protein [Candidatus Eremiobacteraeota bacterium]
MTLFQDAGANPSGDARALGAALALYGAIGDYALGNDPAHGRRTASVACGIAEIASVSESERHAIYFAGMLHAIGALGNSGVRKRDALAARAAMMERWNVPAQGARICDVIAALPKECADLVRWHREAWDGTGYPDQLRWHGIPKYAQFLHLAEVFLEFGDPEEAMAAIVAASGRLFSPEEVRTFLSWFHTSGGEVEILPVPHEALDPKRTSTSQVFFLVSEAIDAHNLSPGRSTRVATLARATAAAYGASETECDVTEAAARLFGIGEFDAEELEWRMFDPLAALGREVRGTHAATSAAVVAHVEEFAAAAGALRARAEWFDGTGLPGRLRADAIPTAARVLAVAIAYEALDEGFRTQFRGERFTPQDRIESASGTQFDPKVVRAFQTALKAKV